VVGWWCWLLKSYERREKWGGLKFDWFFVVILRIITKKKMNVGFEKRMLERERD